MDRSARRYELLANLKSGFAEARTVAYDPQRAQAAAELAGLLADRPLDLEAVEALGRHHWLRYGVLPQIEAPGEDIALALQALTPCFLLSEDISQLPAPALTLIAEAIPDPVPLLRSLGVPVEQAVTGDLFIWWSRMLWATPPLSPNFAPRLARVAQLAARHCEETGRTELLDPLMDDFRRSLTMIAPGHPNRANVLTLAASTSLIRDALRERIDDLDEILAWTREALAETEESSAAWGRAAWLLSYALFFRGEDGDAAEDSAEALGLLRKIHASAEIEDPPQLPLFMVLLGAGDELEDDDFVSLLTAAEEAGLIEGPVAASFHAVTRNYEALLEEGLDDDTALERAERMFQSLMAVPDADDEFLFDVRVSLAQIKLRRLGLGSDGPGIDEAIGLLETAMTTASDPPQRQRVAQVLAIALRHRQSLRDDPADGDRAAALSREFGEDGTARFEKLKADLEMRAARRLPPPGQILPADAFDSRTGMQQIQGIWTDLVGGMVPILLPGNADETDPAVDPRLMAALATLLGATGAQSGLDDAVPFEQGLQSVEAVAADLPEDGFERMLMDVMVVCMRGMGSSAAGDLDGLAAFSADARALLASGRVHDGLAQTVQVQVALANSMRCLWEGGPLRKGRVSPETERDALDSLDELTAICRGRVFTPSRRVMAARVAADIARHLGRPEAAAAALAAAVTSLPEVAPWHVRAERRRRHLAQYTGLTSGAAALTLAEGEGPAADEAALQLLETGRNVLQNQVIAARTDVGDLQRLAPELAERYKGLTALLSEDERLGAPGVEPESRHQTAEALKQVVTEIRAVPGFGDFADVPPMPKLLAETVEGPVVTLNLSPYGSHALIARPDGIQRVALQDVSSQAAAEQVSAFLNAVQRFHAVPAPPFTELKPLLNTVKQVLTWAHHGVTGPVLDALGFAPRDPDDCPRLWWAPGGLLSLLPLHAAGDYGLARPVITADRAISSYTPTIRQLRYAREAARARGVGPLRGLAVAVSGGGGRPLLKVDAEVAALRGRFPSVFEAANLLSGEKATRHSVLERLHDCSIAHFACHAVSDPVNPADSRIVLSDHATAPLSVAELSLLDIPHGRLAYLSACQTAQNANGLLLDEALHLAAACQVAGFEQVIGTLWPVADETAADFSQRFYGHLAAEGDLDPSGAARAAHLAMHETRAETGPVHPHRWSAWVHYGL